MAEYIERDALRNAVRKNSFTKYDWSEEIDVEDFEKVLDEIPSVDVAPVVHSRWIDEVELRPELYGWVPLNSVVCSNCNKSNGRETPYCPNCGAKMDLDVTDINVGDKGGEINA